MTGAATRSRSAATDGRMTPAFRYQGGGSFAKRAANEGLTSGRTGTRSRHIPDAKAGLRAKERDNVRPLICENPPGECKSIVRPASTFCRGKHLSVQRAPKRRRSYCAPRDDRAKTV